MFSYRYLMCVGLVVVFLRNVRGALSKEDIQKMHESLEPALKECANKYSLEKEDFIEAKKKNDFSNIDPCFFSCLLTQMELVEDGKFNPEKAIERTKPFISDKDDATKIAEIINGCIDDIGDDMGEGEEVCNKAQLIVSCFEKHKFQMD